MSSSIAMKVWRKFQRPEEVSRGRPQDVGRGRPLALYRGPVVTTIWGRTYGDVHRDVFWGRLQHFLGT